MPASQVSVNGAIGLLSSRNLMGAAGAYYNVTNPTPGTAIAWTLLTSYSATANGLFVIANQGTKTIYLDRLSLYQSAAAATGTLHMEFDVWNETGIVTGTGNVATRTPVQLNTGAGFSQATGAVVQSFAAGAITIPAAASGQTRRLQDRGGIATGLTFIHDQFVVDFGSDGPSASIPGLTAARLTTPARFSTSMAPIVVGPSTTSWINMYWVTAAANTPSFEFSLGYIEI